MSYIDREATVKALNRLCDRVCQYSQAQRYAMCGACPLGDAFIVIEDDMPDADVEPVRHGEWITVSDGIFADRHYCSACMNYAEVDLYGEEILSKYCLNCGALMDKREADT